jgi:hypothetical protein
MIQQPSANDVEEVVVPGVAALAGILLTGLLYLVLPPNVIIGPNWLLLVIEGVFVIPPKSGQGVPAFRHGRE